MPSDKAIPGSPRDWLARAKGSLALAKQPKAEEAFWEDQCFLAQQAAEKAIKAVYQHKGLLFRYTHDLEELGKGLEDSGVPIPSVVKEATILTRYAFEERRLQMPTLDRKATAAFAGKVVRKDLVRKVKVGTNVPVFVLESLLGKYCATDDSVAIDAGLRVVNSMLVENFVRPDEANKGQSFVAEPLRIGMDNGARRALMPIENKRHFLDVSADIMERVAPIFYSDPLTAAMKALGMN